MLELPLLLVPLVVAAEPDEVAEELAVLLLLEHADNVAAAKSPTAATDTNFCGFNFILLMF